MEETLPTLQVIIQTTSIILRDKMNITVKNFGNMSASNETELVDRNQFILPIWKQIMWSSLFVAMILVATIGNLIVIYIVVTNRQMRTVTNYFLVNLSIADALVSTLNVTFNFVYMLSNHWPFGHSYCKISQFIAVLTICASVFTLMAISIDRYMAIVKPLKPRLGRRATLFTCFVIWKVSALISLPMFLYHTTFTEHFANGDVRVVCYGDWPDDSNHEYIYNIVFTILTYFLPITSMTITYAQVGCVLWGSNTIGENTERQLENVRSKRRVVRMMIVVIIIFGICWLPFHLYFILTSYNPDITQEPYIQELYLGIYWLAMSNSMYNPIIYCWMNMRFRKGFLEFLTCFPCIRRYLRTLKIRDEAMTSRRNPFVASRLSRNGTSTAAYFVDCSKTNLQERIRSGA